MSEESTSQDLIKFIDDSRALLDRARAEAVRNDKDTDKQESDISKEFKQTFPGLAGSSSGRSLQQSRFNVVNHSRSRERRALMPYSRRGTSASYTPSTTWTHEFLCLNIVNEVCTPSSSDSQSLTRAGLGRKKIVFKDKFGDHTHIKTTLETYFPRYTY